MWSGINLPFTSNETLRKVATSPMLNFLFVNGDNNSRVTGGCECLVISPMWGVYHDFLTYNRCSVNVNYLFYVPYKMSFCDNVRKEQEKGICISKLGNQVKAVAFN